ncbi:MULTISPECIES: LysR substrate-binding domain-containing protein [Psychrobacter]|jgi:DNA-binding transcriptional LysR family regulator|uniref:LysR substrate-binding domain-containing protein n=1 Tax=Psychrobacter TaxID=497 RepID=UPI00086C8F89|nr:MULTISPECIES: LysR substrate-binding domain-containing protein [Psychrobacter]MBA6244621.1 LysR family transcriptional regulator [Psychrobacter sp. Urea-trap-18]MBA6285121.1 LysR family transcriptional regulator [Psychrobacter sp. Urea-trap-16]MBA6319524.1 LysR family transcriptional regulator [Psychrobacter sp. Urea-trap-20]MBA6334097.1 LysR family transcriptional regulator [Psychrobacter sp. Urea-trap-19]OEH67460.1 MAG: LysR family transcriptional regulator [Psychrobacter sp. B29-1]|tara:strand:+ start:50369 stop:51304 length:936 start_codon:yes stop_codon:yes gene_type:complete
MKKSVQTVPKITLKQLAVFVSIYQTGSTSRASEELHLSQSAVSSALTELESRLQMPLFERVGRRLNQHPNAHPIYIQAQAILGQSLTLEHYHQYQAGQIHIGASTTIGNYVLPSLLGKLYEALPDANVDMYIANTQEVVSEVEQLNIDIALVEGMPRPVDMKAIEQREWRTDTLMIFAKRDSKWLKGIATYSEDKDYYQLSINQLAQLPLLVREAGSGTRQIIDEQLLKYLPNAEVVKAIHQSEAIKHMVSADIGLGCLSQHVIETELATGELVQVNVAGIDLSRTWWLVWHKARHQSPIWQTFIDIIQQS